MIYLHHTKEDVQILARMPVAAVVANAHADRADAAIMRDAQESPSIMADRRGYVRGYELGQFAYEDSLNRDY